MTAADPRVTPVRHGRVRPTGSWLYVWIDLDTAQIAYVGATGLDPELRTHLHLTDDEPDIGRVRATVPRYAERDFDVLAFELPTDIDRPRAKRALIARLSRADPHAGEETTADDLPDVTIPILEGIERHRRRVH